MRVMISDNAVSMVCNTSIILLAMWILRESIGESIDTVFDIFVKPLLAKLARLFAKPAQSPTP